MNKPSVNILQEEAIELLKKLIALPSFSKEEAETASVINQYLAIKGLATTRVKNNVFVQNRHFHPDKPTILLNSHHDTVKPSPMYTKNPFSSQIEGGKLYGLGSNDAGGCVVSLIAAFLHFNDKENLKYNLVLAITAEEEISGQNGIEYALKYMPPINFAIVGEPTLLQMAVAERGLMVLDGIATGKGGHAARNEGVNAIYKAVKDIEWLRNVQFNKVSAWLGGVQIAVTVIETDNKAHNVVPAECRFVADIRVNELYTFEEILSHLTLHLESKITPRSTRLKSTMIPLDHPLVKAGHSLGLTTYGSPTTSDKALMPFPALKIGPGDSARSHTADEFIFVDEIKNGILVYINLLKNLL